MIKIKVAIMGAGLSGLACARILEENGVTPTIFEKRSELGDRFVNCEILLSILSKPLDDIIKHLSDKYSIYLRPQSAIRKLIIHSENEKAEIKGNLGFTNLRGRTDNSFEKQLGTQVNSEIIFNSNYSYEELLREFTHVILATGDAAYAIKLQDYRVDIRARLKGVNVEGEFEPDTVQGWLNNKFAPDGYAYLIPISNSKAHLVIAYPEYPGNQLYDSKKLLNNFLDEASNFLNQEFRIKDHFEINNYIIGICSKPRIGNTFFVGNNFGAIMPFLGFGQTPALLTGIYAALDIAGKGTYEELIQPLKNSYSDSLTLRKTLEKMNNKQLDLFVKSLRGKAGQKLFTGSHNYLKVAAKILKPLISTKNPGW